MTDTPLTRHSHREGALSRVAGAIALALCKLHQIQFDAPWNPRRHRC